MPGVSSSSPAVLLARLTAHTTRLRLGAGGVLLPNHPPLIVAEQYGLLQALAPNRIDLGLGRAPGTNQATAAALRRGRSDNDDFPQLPQQVNELLHFLDDDSPEGPLPRARPRRARTGTGQGERTRTDDRPPLGLAAGILRILRPARRPPRPALRLRRALLSRRKGRVRTPQ